MQALADIPGWSDTNILFLQNDAGFSGDGVGSVMAALGAALWAGGAVTERATRSIRTSSQAGALVPKRCAIPHG